MFYSCYCVWFIGVMVCVFMFDCVCFIDDGVCFIDVMVCVLLV